MARKLFAALKPPRRVHDNLWLCTVPQIPFRRLPGVDALNRWFGIRAVRRALRAAGISRTISWFVVPHPGFMAGHLGESLCVYYCIDDYAAHPGRRCRPDRRARRGADAHGRHRLRRTTRVARRQARTESAIRSLRRTASTSTSSRKALDESTEIPAAARDLAHPVIGYFGSLHEWIDFELIESLASARPAMDVPADRPRRRRCFAARGTAERTPRRRAAVCDAAIVGEGVRCRDHPVPAESAGRECESAEAARISRHRQADRQRAQSPRSRSSRAGCASPTTAKVFSPRSRTRCATSGRSVAPKRMRRRRRPDLGSPRRRRARRDRRRGAGATPTSPI